MRGDSSSHKFKRVEDRIGLMVKEDINLDQMTETGAMVQTAIQDRIIGVTDLEEILEKIADTLYIEGRVVEKVIEMKGMVTTTIEIGTDQGREHLKETIEGIEGSSNGRSRSGSRASTNRDTIRCFLFCFPFCKKLS